MENKVTKPSSRKKSRSTTPTGFGSGSNTPQPAVKHKNTFGACLRCKYKKIKCDLGPADQPMAPPCAACRRSRSHCFFNAPKVKMGKIAEILNANNNHINRTAGNSNVTLNANIQQPFAIKEPIVNGSNGNVFDPTNPELLSVTIEPRPHSSASMSDKEHNKSDTTWKLELTSMQSALEFLAKATTLRDDQISNDQIRKTQYDINIKIPDATDPNNDLLSTTSNNSTTTQESSNKSPLDSSYPIIDEIKPEIPSPVNHNFDLLGDGKLVTMDEAKMLVNIFFNFMHPFFPYIPLHLQNFEELLKYPLLLHCILAISARYNPLDKVGFDNGIDGKRNILVHNKLWTHCQTLLSQTIWAEASTRSIGTTLAFLLFTEWNPRAIHWEVSDSAHYVTERESPSRNSSGLGGIATVKRSDRMAWMFTGAAIRLAQEMDFLENNAKVYTAANSAEICYASNMNQKPTLGESLVSIDEKTNEIEVENPKSQDDIENEDLKIFTDIITQNPESAKRWLLYKAYSDRLKEQNLELLIDLETEFLNDEYTLFYHDNSFFRNPIPYTVYQKAQLELLRIVTITYQTIYYERIKKRVSNSDQRKNLMILDVLSPIINAWYLNYYKLMKPVSDEKPVVISLDDLSKFKRTADIRGESFISDYYYCQLYTFSLALQVEVKESKLSLNEMIKSARFVEQAYRAAKEILKSAIRVHKIEMLKYMPVRWVMRIVRSASFIVKCYITLIDHSMATNSEAKSILKLSGILVDDAVHMIRQAAVILNEATPDELHLARKFSTILMFLCKEIHERTEKGGSKPNINDIDPQIPITSKYGGAATPISHNSSSKEDSTARTAEATDITRVQTISPNNNQEECNSLSVPIDEAGQFNNALPEDVVDWFSGSSTIGLGFVEPWTELIEQKYIQNGQNLEFDELFNEFAIKPNK